MQPAEPATADYPEPMILYAAADLIFATKIRSTCEALNRVSRPVRNAAMLQARLDRVDDGKANDAAELFFVDLELGEVALQLIAAAVAHPAPLRTVAFGPHVMVEALAAARDAGAHATFTRGTFTQRLPELVGGGDDLPG